MVYNNNYCKLTTHVEMRKMGNRYGPAVYINNNKLDYVGNVKYLGVIICYDMKDDEDMLRHLRSFYARSNSTLRKFHNCSVD